MKKWRVVLPLAMLLLVGSICWPYVGPRLGPKKTVAQRLAEYAQLKSRLQELPVP
jgi:hypothetical protein